MNTLTALYRTFACERKCLNPPLWSSHSQVPRVKSGEFPASECEQRVGDVWLTFPSSYDWQEHGVSLLNTSSRLYFVLKLPMLSTLQLILWMLNV